MAKTNDIKENFSALLRDSLRSQFGRIPSAAVFAREFNLRAYDTSPISQESARRWLRGVSLPEEARLRVLVNWLHLNFNDALRPGRIHVFRPVMAGSGVAATAGDGNAAKTELFSGAPGDGHAGMHLPDGSALTEQDAKLLSAIFSLGEQQRAAIFGLISATGNAGGTGAAKTSVDTPVSSGHQAPVTAPDEATRSLRRHP